MWPSLLVALAAVGAGQSVPGVGDVVCRYKAKTPSAVNYYTCSELASKYVTTVEQFFELNPGVTPDCSNINPSSEYCVKGCMSQLLSILHDNIPIFEESLGLFVADTNKIYSTLYRLTGSVVPITVTHPARELTFNAATPRPGSVERPSEYIFLWYQIFGRIS